MPRPAVLFGGPSPEHDISILTGLLAARALSDAARDVHALYWSKTGNWFEVDAGLEGEAFAAGVPSGARPVRLVAGGGFVAEGGLRRERRLDIDAAVNCCHGGPGEDGTLQGALDLAGVTYTGPSVAGASLGMDKLAFGAVVHASNLPSLPRAGVVTDDGWKPPFAGPYIVKPRFGGSSIGIEVAADPDAVTALARTSVHLRAGAVVEPFRGNATEVQIAVRAHPSVIVSNLLQPRRGDGAGAFYSYAEKYVPGEGMHAAQGDIDPDLPAGVAEALRDAARTVAGAALVRGVARVDFLIDGDEWFLNEINTVPGSLSKHLWVDPSVAFVALLDGLVEEARTRPTTAAWSTEGADGSALRSAGSIAGKLG